MDQTVGAAVDGCPALVSFAVRALLLALTRDEADLRFLQPLDPRRRDELRTRCVLRLVDERGNALRWPLATEHAPSLAAQGVIGEWVAEHPARRAVLDVVRDTCGRAWGVRVLDDALTGQGA